MEVTEITVSAGRTFNHPYETYSNLRPGVTVKAIIAPGEDPTKAINDLQALAEKTVEDHKQALLHSLEELHYLTEAQRDMTTLAEQITRSQVRLEEIRKNHPQLSLGMGEYNRTYECCGRTPEEGHRESCPEYDDPWPEGKRESSI
jgi:hypothetical protein